MPRYFIRFKANHKNGNSTEHTRYVDLQYPIEYDSDVAVVQNWATNHVGAVAAILVDWKLMKGTHRPEFPDGPAAVIDR